MNLSCLSFAGRLVLASALSLGAKSLEAAPLLYVTGTATGVFVVDTATNALVTTFNPGIVATGIAILPSGATAYIADTGGTAVSVIDIATNTVTTTVPVGSSPRGIALNPAGTRLYVPNSGSDSVTVIDTASNVPVTTISLGAGTNPVTVVVDPTGARAYVTNFAAHNVSVIDTATNTLLPPINVGTGPYGIAMDPAGTHLYVANQTSNSVSIIDASTNTVITTIPVGVQPYSVAVTPNGALVYVANSGSNTYSAIDTATNTVIATIPGGNTPVGVVVDPTGASAYGMNASSRTITVIDTATNLPSATIVTTGTLFLGAFVSTVPGAPTGAAATPGNAQATVTFAAPASDGGTPITGYTVTSSPPGGVDTTPGTGLSHVITGLINGTPYTFTVAATNAAGTGAASAATSSVTPTMTSFTGPTATASGTATVSFTGGGTNCTFAPQGTGALQSAFFIPLTGSPKSPPSGPPGVTFPHGLLDFVLIACTPGSTVNFTVTYPSVLAAGTLYYKYGPTPGNAAAHWYTLPATIAGNTATFSITDGALGDDDGAADGTIMDQGGPGLPPPAGAGAGTAVPTLSEWMLLALATLMMMSGVAVMRRARA
jgi:YVTN family beta-propeller protein